MKKTFALLLVIVLALSLSITAFAAVTSSVSSVTISGGTGGTVSAFITPDAYTDESAAVAAAKSAASGYSSSSLTEIAAFDLTSATGTVTFSVPAVAGKYVVLMHYITGTGSWVKEYAGYTDATTGSFTFTLGSNSPFVLFTYTPSSYIGGGSNVTAPKTADTTPIALLTGLAVMSVLGCAYCIKRSRA